MYLCLSEKEKNIIFCLYDKERIAQRVDGIVSVGLAK